jgi:hypothetical protein
MLITTDYEKGFADRACGFYDKWYRYNRHDDGAEYDRGCVACVNSGSVYSEEFTLIEAN